MSSFDKNRLHELDMLNKQYNFATQIVKAHPYRNEPNLHFYSLKVNSTFGQNINWGNSIQTDEIKSLILSYYETIERFFSAKYDVTQLKYCSYNELNSSKIDISIIINNDKVKKVKNINNNKIYWAKVQDLFSLENVYMPAQMVFLPFKEKGDFKIREPISTGTACGENELDAIVRGILECIERDNFMVTFLSKQNPKKIINYTSDLIEYIEIFNIRVNLFKLNSDKKFNTILCILEDLSLKNPPSITVGCDCGFNINTTIEKSILEALKIRIWIKTEIINNNKQFIKSKNKKNIKTMVDKGFYWSHQKNKKKIDFILRTKKIINFSTIKSEDELNNQNIFEILKNYLKRNKCNLYVKHFNNYNLMQKNIYITKVIIPELHPLYLNEKFKYNIGNRIKTKIVNNDPVPFL